MTLSISDAARDLWERGLVPVPVNQNKQPLITFRQFAERDMTESELLAAFPEQPDSNLNLAILTRRIVVIDCDGEDAYRWAIDNLPAPGWTCKTGRGWHLYYRCPYRPGEWQQYSPRNSSFHKGDDGSRHIDIKSGVSYVLAPPSAHQSGNVYVWVGEGPHDSAALDAVNDLPVLAPEDYKKVLTHISRAAPQEHEPRWIRRGENGAYTAVEDGAEVSILLPERVLTDIDRKNLDTLLKSFDRDPQMRHGQDLSQSYLYDPWYKIILATRNTYGDGDEVRAMITEWARRDHAGWDDRESRRAIENIWHSPYISNSITLKAFYGRAQREFGWVEDHGLTVDLGSWERPAEDPGPVFDVVSFNTLAEMQPPAPDWVITNFAERGAVTLLTAWGGIGKTTFLADLAYHLQAGQNYGAIEVPRPARALLLLCESTNNDLARYVETCDIVFQKRALAPASAVPQQEVDNGVMLMAPDPKTRALQINQRALLRLQHYIDRSNADLLVIDTLYDVFGGEENSRSEVTQFFNQVLQPLARRSNIAILVTVHRSKTGLMSGSTALANKANTVVSLTIPPKYVNESIGKGRIVPREDLGMAFPIRELRIIKANNGPVGSLGQFGVFKSEKVSAPVVVPADKYETLVGSSLEAASEIIRARELNIDPELVEPPSDDEPWHKMVASAAHALIQERWTAAGETLGPSAIAKTLNRRGDRPWEPYINTLTVGDIDEALGLIRTELLRPGIGGEPRDELIKVKIGNQTAIIMRSMIDPLLDIGAKLA